MASYPLFFYSENDRIIVSDDGCLIAKSINVSVIEGNVNELLQTGYVTGRETVFEDVYRLTPGSKVMINKVSGEIKWQEYYSLNYRCDSNKSPKELAEDYDKELIQIFTDFSERLKGRTVVVPLSGGADSRTVAVMLKRLGYKKVMCFSYGAVGNNEAAISKKVAENIGFEWHNTLYDAKKWKKYLTSQEYVEYLKYSFRGGSIAHVQDMIALLEMKHEGILPKDCVFCPGHTQDVICGSHIDIFPGRRISKKNFSCLIRGKHYILNDNVDYGKAPKKWEDDIPASMDNQQFVNSYMRWEWQNRQSKFIANSVRAYEYVGYRFDMPFWSRQNLDFWGGVPLESLKGRTLQYLHLKEKIEPIAGLDLSYSYSYLSPVRVAAKYYLKKHRKSVVWMYAKKKRCDAYLFSEKGAEGRWSKEEFRDRVMKYRYSYNNNTERALDTLEYLNHLTGSIARSQYKENI